MKKIETNLCIINTYNPTISASPNNQNKLIKKDNYISFKNSSKIVQK